MNETIDGAETDDACATIETPDVLAAPITRVAWGRTHRVIGSRFPPIHLFDDIADPADWEILARAESRTNPRIYEEIGDLSLIPVARRISGPGAGWVIGAFTHVSKDRASRFSDGSYGVYYAAESVETALCEHAFHMGRFYASTAQTPGWLAQIRELIGTIDADMADLRGNRPEFAELLDPDPASYPVPQRFAAALRAMDANGVVYPSLRHPGGSCFAAFWPNVVTPPSQGDHYRYHWNGKKVDLVQRLTGDKPVFSLP